MVARLTHIASQTDTSEFLDLRQLQLASSQQQSQLVHLRNELQTALAQAAQAVERTAGNTATARIRHHR